MSFREKREGGERNRGRAERGEQGKEEIPERERRGGVKETRERQR